MANMKRSRVKKIDIKPWPFVEVHWWDAVALSGWQDPRDTKARPCLCITRGWLIRDEPDFVAVAGSLSYHHEHQDLVNELGEVTAIPNGMIEAIWEIIPAGKPPK